VPRSWIEFRFDAAREIAIHPWLRPGVEGYTANGRPARLVADEHGNRIRLVPDVAPHALEFVAADVPAFGWKRFRLEPSVPHPDDVDAGRDIECDAIAVRASDDGTLEARFGERRYAGLLAVEDVGDRGDTYDFDPVSAGAVTLEEVRVVRHRSRAGVLELAVERVFSLPAALAADRRRRDDARARVALTTTARLVPGTGRIDLHVRVTNGARDHRLRLLFPTGAGVSEFRAATTFDVARRTTAVRDGSRWIHPAPATFPQQGFVAANGLVVAAPGLPEAEVTPAGVIAITLVRAVGWLARMDLETRPQLAGPAIPVPGAQCLETIGTHLALFGDLDPRRARDAELGLRAVTAGDAPLAPPDAPLLEVTPHAVVVTALKPAEEGPGMVLRMLNPTDEALAVRLRFGLPLVEARRARLDETPEGDPLPIAGGSVTVDVPAHALRSLLVRTARPAGAA
jgi:alpha-mannosidase/mannosylglycerate hydrolase